METEFHNTYANYFDLAISFDRGSRTFTGIKEGRGQVLSGLKPVFRKEDGSEAPLPDDFEVECFWEQPPHIPCTRLTIRLTRETEEPRVIDLVATVERDRIVLRTDGLPTGWHTIWQSDLHWGAPDDCFAVCLDRPDEGGGLRSAFGPAVSPADDALFDRMTDEGMIVRASRSHRFGFSWERNAYTLTADGDLTISFRKHIFEQKFNTQYHPINKNNTFPTPPAGWMTWYAVLFHACEKRVLDNAEKQKELLAEYGANTIWVDWEWYHSAFDNPDAPDSIGYCSPDPERYPHGLRYVSDKIRELGFVPALWVGPTSEPALTETVKKYYESVYVDKVSWCGRYFFDITDERIRDEWIPEAFAKIKEWGYDALKWDCLPITLAYADQFHDALKHPETTSTEALRQLVEKARETVGENFYMLSCAGVNDREVMMASDLFDAARIGNDIFTWREFVTDFIERILRFYPYHNTVLYCDPDNVVIRPEFNHIDQARSRVSAVALLGLPVTLGDDLTVLPEERVELLRRTLPPLDIHPKDIREGKSDGKRFVINLAVNRSFEAWNVAGVMNLLEEEAEITVDLSKDLLIEPGEYLIFDYWKQRFLGVFFRSVTVRLPGASTAVLAIRRVTGRPQILSTSRHLTQGAQELVDVKWVEESRTLKCRLKAVRGDANYVYLYVPDGYQPEFGTVRDHVMTLAFPVEKTGEIDFAVVFS